MKIDDNKLNKVAGGFYDPSNETSSEMRDLTWAMEIANLPLFECNCHNLPDGVCVGMALTDCVGCGKNLSNHWHGMCVCEECKYDAQKIIEKSNNVNI